MGKINIAIDEPAPSDKSTVAKVLAGQPNYVYYDTGVMYRAITYLALQSRIDIRAEEPLVALCINHTISFQQARNDQRIFVGDREVIETVRQPDMTNAVSAVSKHTRIREEAVALQQRIGQADGVVMDSQDIGTVVLPKAEVKIFLATSAEERAEHHFKENQEKGIRINFETLEAEIEHRDCLDSTREVSPPIQASDAVKIDTTDLTIGEAIAATQNVTRQKGFEFF